MQTARTSPAANAGAAVLTSSGTMATFCTGPTVTTTRGSAALYCAWARSRPSSRRLIRVRACSLRSTRAWYSATCGASAASSFLRSSIRLSRALAAEKPRPAPARCLRSLEVGHLLGLDAVGLVGQALPGLLVKPGQLAVDPVDGLLGL